MLPIEFAIWKNERTTPDYKGGTGDRKAAVSYAKHLAHYAQVVRMMATQ